MSDEREARFLIDMPIAQLKALAAWADDSPGMSPRVRLYLLPEDMSIDIHQSDAHTNIELSGKDVG